MRRLDQALALSVLVGLCGAPTLAQSDGNAPLVLELQGSTRAAGIGGAYVLSEPEHDAVFYNPGLLEGRPGIGLAAARYGGNSTFVTFSAVKELAGGGVSMGVQALSYGTGGPALSAIPEDANDLLSGGSYPVSELVGSIGYGREIFGFGVGLVAKAVDVRVGNGRDATVAADFGILAEVFGGAVGVSVQNVGPGLGVAGENMPLPRRFTLGASTPSAPVGPFDMVATTAVSYRRDGEIVPAGGLELSWWPIYGRTFVGRVGVRRVVEDGMSPITFGIAFHADDVTFEYAFEQFDAPGAAHRIGLSWH